MSASWSVGHPPLFLLLCMFPIDYSCFLEPSKLFEAPLVYGSLAPLLSFPIGSNPVSLCLLLPLALTLLVKDALPGHGTPPYITLEPSVVRVFCAWIPPVNLHFGTPYERPLPSLCSWTFLSDFYLCVCLAACCHRTRCVCVCLSVGVRSATLVSLMGSGR